MAKHYTAVIEINTVNSSETTHRTPEVKREVNEVSRVVVRADTLSKLVAKAGAHLALIED